MPQPTSEEGQRLLEAAYGLFAELGYDQTESQMIADVAGVSVAAIKAEFGSKRGLYLEVMKRVHLEEQEIFEQMAAHYTYDAEGLHRIVDRYLDYFVDHPRSAALWAQRRMYDATDLREVEVAYNYPPARNIVEMTAGAVRPEVDMELLVWTIVWAVQTFVYSGFPNAEGGRVDATDPRALERFRRHIHTVVGALTR